MLLADLFKSSHNLSFFDSIDSNSNFKNCLLIPKLLCNKEEKKEKIIFILEKAYEKLKFSLENNNNELSHYPLFNFYLYGKEDSINQELQNNNNSYMPKMVNKIYTVFPNINFELKQMKNLPFSNTNLNRFLVGKSNDDDFKGIKDGFFTMSQNHRLIALKNDIYEKGGIHNSQSLKQIIFGIWMNYSDQNISPKKVDIFNFLEQNKKEIYRKCFNFIQISSKIETIYSPSPDQSVFILVLFFKGMQCHYEVKLIPNEEEKLISYEGMTDSETNHYLSNFGPNWLIAKSKLIIDSHNGLNYSLKSNLKECRITPLSEYYERKSGINQRSLLTKSSNNNTYRNANSKNSINMNFQDNLIDIFNNSGLDLSTTNDLYCLPLMIQQNKPNNTNHNNHNNSNDIYNPQKQNLNSSCKKNIYEMSTASTNTLSSKSKISNNSETNLKEIILEQGKIIQQLQTQVSSLEVNIKNVLDELLADYSNDNNEPEENENIEPQIEVPQSNNNKNEHNDNNKLSIYTNITKQTKHDISTDDKSFQVPKIVFQESLLGHSIEEEYN